MGKRIAGLSIILSVVAAATAVWPNFISAQQGPGHSMAIVVHEENHAVSKPLRNIPPIPSNVLQKLTIRLRHPHPLSGIRRLLPDPALQTSTGPLVTTSSESNFAGVGVGLGTFYPMYAPPDTNGAVGPTEYVQWVNVNYAVFAKYDNEVINGGTYNAGDLVVGLIAGNAIFSALGAPCSNNNSGDPISQYDKQANRWVLMQPVFKNPYTLCVAVSQTADASGSYNLYSFSVPGNYFPDYPKLGVWPDGYYVSYNSFQGNSFVGAAACAMDRTSMLQGQAATMQCFQRSYGDASLLPSDLDGDSGAAGTTGPPPTGAPNYFLELGSNTSLDLYKFHVDWTNSANSTFVGPTSISVPSYSLACGGGTCIPQSGSSSELLDSLGDRLMYRLAYRNLNGVGTLVATHSVDTGSGNTGVRWYEIQGLGTTPTAVQKSTFAPDSNYRWMGSIGMDKFGDIALGYSVSGSTMYPAIRYTGRLSSDAANTMEGEASIVEGGGSQSNTSHRWGDYSAMSVDPVDDCTFYYTNEYLLSSGSFNWSTRVGSFGFTASNCSSASYSISASATIQAAGQGSNASYTLSLSPSNGYSGTVNLSAVGLPSGATPSFDNVSIPGTGGSSTLTVSTDGSIPAGTYTFNVQGSDGTLVSLTPLVLVVTPPTTQDFSISASPSSSTVNQGQSANYTVTVSSLNSFSGTVDLGASVSPSGPTPSIPPSVSVTSTTPGTATLTVSTASTTTTGAYTVTITGTSGSLNHQTQVTLQVNAGSPTGSFSASASAGTINVAVNSSSTDTITVTPSGGFTGSVSLSLSGLPRWTSSSFGTNPVSITGPGAGSSVLTISTNRHAQQGTYVLTLDATSGSLSSQILLTLNIGTASGDFSLSATPSSQTVTQGTGTSYSVSVTGSGGFSSSVDFSASGLPNGANASFSPSSVSGSGSTTMNVTTSSDTPAGTYILTITGTSGSLTHQTTSTLVVNASTTPDFSLAVSPSSQTVTSGSPTSYTATVTALNGFTGTVNLTVSGLPSGANYTPASVSGGSGSTSVAITTSNNTPAGTYPLTITGASGSLTHSKGVTLVVNAPTSGDFSISVSPGNVTLKGNGTASYTVTISSSGGFSNAVALSASGVPSGATYGFSQNPVQGGSGTSTFSVSGAPKGNYSFTIIGTSGSLTHSASTSLKVH